MKSDKTHQKPHHPAFRDLTGQTFGMLTVVRYSEWRNKRTYWLCRCVCGIERDVWNGALTSGHTKSCGRCGRRRPAKQVRSCAGCKKEFPATAEFFYLDRTRQFAGNPNGCSSRCLECTAEYKREWTAKNADRVKANARAWLNRNRERQNRKGVLCKRLLKWELLKAYSGDTVACSCCGETAFEFLTIDHINNDGAKHRKTMDGTHIYLVLKKQGYPPGFQVLCMNCNFAKGKYGYCPHNAPGVDIEACRQEYYTKKPRRRSPA